MGSIPFSDRPLIYEDKQSGVRYLLRQPCGDTETQMYDLIRTLPRDKKKRDDFIARSMTEAQKFNDASIDIILVGWEADKVKLPEFPKDGHPSKRMRIDIKTEILRFYESQKEFTGEEIKK
jgi:hypothetical protein